MADIVPLRTGGKIAGIVPQTIDEVFRLAAGIAKSGLAPAGMKTPEAITVAIMHGLEIGLPPMQAIQRIAVVNGRPTLWGDAVPALLLSRGFKLSEHWSGEGMERQAVCVITRPDGDKIERRFSMADAKKAGLLGKQGPWVQYTDRMLQMRARGFAARDGAADVLSGLYLREEMEDVEQTMRDVTPTKEVITPSSGKALPPLVGEQPMAAEPPLDEIAEAREAIRQAPSLEVLEHLRDIAYLDADWSQLMEEYNAKVKALEGGAP